MRSIPFTRREFSIQIAALLPTLGVPRISAIEPEEISHNNDAIHQRTTFKANPTRVYAALTDPAQFDKVIRLSDAMKGGMPPGAPATAISRAVGGAFSLFGGYITGRQIELATGHLIVQAWRVGSWKPGIYSIARYEMTAQGTGTMLTFDHTGFPAGEAQHLADGWHGNYWQPLHKYLGE